MKLQIINPLHYGGWDELLNSDRQGAFFHTSAWAKVLFESYRYQPLYFAVIENAKLRALLPIMEVRSIFTGCRGVSLPFSDHCEPILADGINLREVMEAAIQYGKNAEWKSLELRDAGELGLEALPSSWFWGHTLDLTASQERLFSNCRRSTQRNVKKAIREGVKVSVCHSLEAIEEFYRLNSMTRREHGLPPQPRFFFRRIYDHIISQKLGMVVLASHRGRPIAGAVYFHFGEKVLYKYGASDKTYQELRANNLVMWEAITWYAQNGFHSLCFGRTDPDHDGLRQFKTGWGTRERVIKYYRYDLKKEAFVKNTYSMNGRMNKIFHRMPISCLNLVGALVYRHMG